MCVILAKGMGDMKDTKKDDQNKPKKFVEVVE